MRGEAPTRAWIAQVARALGPLLDQVVFVGGAVIDLLVTDRAAYSPRVTLDVDLAVAQVEAFADWARLQDTLRTLGFREDLSEGAPTCRWLLGAIVMDAMPVVDGPWGPSNPWYPLAWQTAQRVIVADEVEVLTISAACFIATKIAAFGNRGGSDPIASHDMEDIVTVVDGRPALGDELAEAPEVLRLHVAHTFASWLRTLDMDAVVEAHLLPDRASQARMPEVLQRFRRIAASASTVG